MTTLRPYQQDGLQAIRGGFGAGHRRLLYVLPTGGGKCLAPGTPVMLYDGSVKPVEDIRIGDLLMGPDSKPRRVLSTCCGQEEMFRITPTKGDCFACNRSHVLSVYMTQDGGRLGGRIINISVDRYLRQTSTFQHCAKLWRAAVDFPAPAELGMLDPYFLGVWLGDGSSNGPTVTTGDPEIATFLNEYAVRNGLRLRREPNSPGSEIMHLAEEDDGRFKGRGHRTNPIRNALARYRLLNNKHIPHRYKTGSREERLQVLAGIIDTDGSWSGKGYDLVLKNERLLDDVIFVARSLGFAAYKREAKKTCSNNGVVGTYYRCAISGPCDIIPCRLPRKRGAPRMQRKNPLVTGFKVESLGPGIYYGFEIDGDGLFLLGDFTVTHNTLLFTYIARGIQAKGKRVLIVAHRRELLEQISGALRQWGVPHGVLTGGSRGIPHTNVVVASVFTLVNRLKHWPPPDLIIGDEAHHFTIGSSWGTVVKAFPQAKVLGVTATPERLDGKGLKDVFDHMIVGPTVAELTAQGFLSPAEVYAPARPNLVGVAKRGGDYVRSQLETAMDKPSITGDAIEHYLRLVPGRRAVAFCVSIQHAKDVADQFRRAGVISEHIDGSQDDALRAERIARFRAGTIQVLTSCDLISEGFDLPSIECAILLRPTESLSLYMQQVGRAIRPADGKDRTVILDHAGNTLRHGFIDEPRDWTLTEGAVKKAKAEATVAIRMCPKCYAVHRPAPICPRCGHEYRGGRVVEQRAGTLEQISSAEDMAAAPDGDLRRSYHQLLAVARRRNYQNPQRWAFSVIEGQAAKRRAQQRDAPRLSMVNGLTGAERQALWDETIGRDTSEPEKYVPWGINGGTR